MAEDGTMSIWSVFAGLILLLWGLVMQVLAFVWNLLLEPLLYFLLLCGVMVAILVFVINLRRFGDWTKKMGDRVRDWHDDFALNNGGLLRLELWWARSKWQMEQVWLRLRYNWFVDQLVLLKQEVRYKYDWVMRNSIWIVAVGLAMYAVARASGWTSDDEFRIWDNMTGDLSGKVREWWLKPRKFEGSNSHYRTDLEARVPVVEWVDEVVSAVGGAESVILEPSPVEVVTVTRTEGMFTPSRHRVDLANACWHVDLTETETERPTQPWVITETWVRFTRETEDASSDSRTTNAPPEATESDYWAPPKGKMVISSNEPVWCRECQQFHCCELPY